MPIDTPDLVSEFEAKTKSDAPDLVSEFEQQKTAQKPADDSAPPVPRQNLDPVARAQGQPQKYPSFADTTFSAPPSIEDRIPAARAASPQAAAEKEAGRSLADVAGKPKEPTDGFFTNPRTGQRVPLSAVPEADAIPVLDAWKGAEPVATGLSRINENQPQQPQTNPKFGTVGGKFPTQGQTTPQLTPEQAKTEETRRRQRSLGAAEVLQGSGELMTPLAVGSGMVNPFPVILGYGAGYGASEGAGAIVHGKVSPEDEQLIRAGAFFLPSALGIAAGLKTGSTETPQGKFSAASIFGGKVKAGVGSTPDLITGRVKFGDTQFEITVPRGKPGAPGQSAAPAPQLTEGEQAMVAHEQSTGAIAKPAPPVPLGQKFGNKLSGTQVAGLSKVIAEAPEEERNALIEEAHTNIGKWIHDNNGRVFIAGKVVLAKSPDQVEGLAAKIINDAGAAHDKATVEAAKTEDTKANPADILGSTVNQGFWHDKHVVVDGQDRANIEPQIDKLVKAGMSRSDAYDAVVEHAQGTGKAVLESLHQGDVIEDSTGTKWKVHGRFLETLDESGNTPDNAGVLPLWGKETIALAADSKVSARSGNAEKASTSRPSGAVKPAEKQTTTKTAQPSTPAPAPKPAPAPAKVKAQPKTEAPQSQPAASAPKQPSYEDIVKRVRQGGTIREGALRDKFGVDRATERQLLDRMTNEGVLGSPQEHGWRSPKPVVQKVEEKPPHDFASTQVNIDPNSEMGRQHAEAVAAMPDEHIGPNGKEDTPHVTVRYGLKDDSPEAIAKIKEAASKIAPFEATVGNTGSFPATKEGDRPIIAQIEKSPELNALRSAVEGAGDFKPDDHGEYKPHVTLGYVKPEHVAEYEGGSHLEGRKVPVDHVVVSKKDRTSEVIKLGGKPVPDLVAEHEAQPERRQNLAERKRVADMSADERAKALLTSETVDLPNKRAFAEAEHAGKSPAIAMSDADGLKAFNDKYGYEAGNTLLKAKADSLKEAGIDAYHDKGDEFLHRGESPEDLKTKLEQARKSLRNKEFTVTDATGKQVTLKGVDFSYGTGTDLATAEAGLKSHKAKREAAGARARGELRGITEVGHEAPAKGGTEKVAPARAKIAERVAKKKAPAIQTSPAPASSGIPSALNPGDKISTTDGRTGKVVGTYLVGAKSVKLDIGGKTEVVPARNLAPGKVDRSIKGKPSERGFAHLDIPSVLAHGVADPVTSFVKDTIHKTAESRSVDDKLFGLSKQYEADVLRAVELMKQVGPLSTPEDQAAIYHHLEDSSVPLDPKQQAVLDKIVKPLMSQSSAIRSELNSAGVPMGEEGYVHRVVKGKSSQLERAMRKQQGTGKGNVLSKSAASLKQRKMFALEDEDGNRRVVSMEGGRITGFSNGTPTDMGASPRLKVGDDFTDKTGKTYTLAQSTTKEIEASTHLEYYKNALASAVTDYLQLLRAKRANDALESMKADPGFNEMAFKSEKGSMPPDGWRSVDLPQFRDYYFEPHMAEVLNRFAKELHPEPATFLEKVGNFMTASLLLNPIRHIYNIGNHWLVERGLFGTFNALTWPTAAKAGMKAIKAVVNQNEDFLSALDQGAPMMSHRVDLQQLHHELFQTIVGHLEKNPGIADQIAKFTGYDKMNPEDTGLVSAVARGTGLRMLNNIRKLGQKAMWMSNDMMMLQSAYEKMANGSDFTEAMKQTERHIPNYRIPTRIMNSKAMGDFMGSRLASMFGRYHYGVWRSYGEMIKEAASPGSSPKERLRGLDHLIMLGLITFIMYPLWKKVLEKLTGDKDARMVVSGASAVPNSIANIAQGKEDPSQLLRNTFTPAILPQAAAEAMFNRDFFSGAPIRNPKHNAAGQAIDVSKHFMNSLGPVQQYNQANKSSHPVKQFLLSQVGVSTSHPKKHR